MLIVSHCSFKGPGHNDPITIFCTSSFVALAMHSFSMTNPGRRVGWGGVGWGGGDIVK